MAKYSFEFKKKIVTEYLNGKGGYTYLSKKYNIPANSNVQKWVGNFNSFGDEGLKRSRKQEKYSFKFKLNVVELYLTSEASYQTLAIQEGITNPALIATWVNRFRVVGPEGLRPHKKGRKKTLYKKNSKDNEQPIGASKIDTSNEHVQQLEDQILKLKIENAFLKELRRLRLEDEAKTRELLKSSALSEDNSN